MVVMCRVLSVSRSGFYASRGRPIPQRAVENVALVEEIRTVFKASRSTYGSPRIHEHFRKSGRRVGKNRVARLMAKMGLKVRMKRKYRPTTNSEHADPIAPNFVDRDFKRTRPNELWVTDVTEIPVARGRAFLAAVVDVFSRRVVGWSVSDIHNSSLTVAALRAACRLRLPAPGAMHHSDRGGTYTSAEYRMARSRCFTHVSMSRKGNCWDNAIAESFFATLKSEHANHEKYERADDVATSLADYIDGFYNTTRLHSSIGYRSPIEFELVCEAKEASL